ncbi:hypothetical protein [Streptomyces sp. NPDC059916]|uniref:hypothetical protein n=1 Tax=Streptomyces sp. NPDC059916 TaxID=3347001 RepID=UPI0036BF05B8
MTTSKPTTRTVPPAAAVAADAHWAAKMQRLRDRKLAEATFVVCDDPAIRTRYTQASRAADLADTYLKSNPKDPEAQSDADTARRERDEAQAAYDQVSIPIKFRALPRPAFEALFKAHPASEDDEENSKEWGSGYPAALISAASVDGMTETEAQELLDSWSLSEANALFNAAYGVQDTTRADLGKG